MTRPAESDDEDKRICPVTGLDCLSCGEECRLEARRRKALDRLMAEDADLI